MNELNVRAMSVKRMAGFRAMASGRDGVGRVR